MPISEKITQLQQYIPIVYTEGDDWYKKDVEYFVYDPSRAVDQRIAETGTRWDSDATGQYMILELPSVTKIRDIWILWYKGYERQYKFKIEASEDKVTWTSAFNGSSNPNKRTDGSYDDHVFTDANKLLGTLEAQFLKITNVDGAYDFNNSKVTSHSSIYDIAVYGHPTDEVYAYSST